MLRQLVLGGAVSLVAIAIHAAAAAAVIWVATVAEQRERGARLLHRLVTVMVVAVAVLMVAHVLEVALWTFVYRLVGAAPDGADVFYFAFVNYTTLGYGDILPTPAWRLLGPFTAMNGMLLFGWSAAVMFAIASATYRKSSEIE